MNVDARLSIESRKLRNLAYACAKHKQLAQVSSLYSRSKILGIIAKGPLDGRNLWLKCREAARLAAEAASCKRYARAYKMDCIRAEYGIVRMIVAETNQKGGYEKIIQ